MTITLYKRIKGIDEPKVERVLPRVRSFLCYSNGSLLVTFEDNSETTVYKNLFDFFVVRESNGTY